MNDNGAFLYNKYKNGDNDALGEIVSLYSDNLLYFINGYVKNIHIAQDILSDTFFRLIISRKNFSEQSSFKTYLYRIARNLSLDYLRKQKRNKEISVSDENTLQDEKQLENAVVNDEQKKQLALALQKLPDIYREALYLVYFENLSYKDTAKILKKNKKQTENIIFRARQSLKKILVKEGFVYEEL